MKQKFNVTGMTCSACSVPRGMSHAPGGPKLFICSGEFSSPEQIKETLGGPVRPAARGTAGAHIAELIKTMLEKKASGIDLK